MCDSNASRRRTCAGQSGQDDCGADLSDGDLEGVAAGIGKARDNRRSGGSASAGAGRCGSASAGDQAGAGGCGSSAQAGAGGC